MDTKRLILLMALGIVVFQLWVEWQKDYGSLQKPTEQPLVESSPIHGEDVPQTPQMELAPGPGQEQIEAQTQPVKESKRISVTTDVLHIEIDTAGGSIMLAELLNFPEVLDQPDRPVKLLYETPESIYIVQGGLLSEQPAPTHEEMYSSPQQKYVLSPNNDILQVPLFWESGNGIRVKKSFTFKRGDHLVQVRYDIENDNSKEWSGRAYGQIQRTRPETSRVRTVYTYTGGVISEPEKRYEKIDFDDMQENKLARNIRNGWIAMLQHYFISALIPGSPTDEYHYYTLALEKERYALGSITPTIKIAQGNKGTVDHFLYLGAKVQKDLKTIAPGLELTVDYGVLWFLAKPLFWCLQEFHVFTGNWGWSIILVTLMLKIAFYKLSAAGYRSMANMRRVQPRLLSIRERYKNDRSRLNQAMMDIYKEEKINPLGGCFPILVQIPVFIALYWVLLESVELRQTPFILWIKDLSGPDPFFVLPIVMGATMLIQQKLNPAPMDPIQEKVMMVLPIVFTVFFAFFPSGLVLYWVVNNILSIAQQWLITRNIELAASKS